MQQNEKLKNEFQELQLQLARVVSFPLVTVRCGPIRGLIFN